MAQNRADTACSLEIQPDSSLQLLQAEFIKQMSKYQQLAGEEPSFAELSGMGYSCARLADGLQNIPLLLLPTGGLSSGCLVVSLSVQLPSGVSAPGSDPVLPGSAQFGWWEHGWGRGLTAPTCSCLLLLLAAALAFSSNCL